MSKRFNTTGVCIPEKHYLVDVRAKLEKIMTMVEEGEYFTIHKPRQYGKTTILYLLARELQHREDYLVLKTSFEGIGMESYRSEPQFIAELLRQIKNNFTFLGPEKSIEMSETGSFLTLGELSDFITALVRRARKKVVLIIDEVDQSSNQEIFLHFLGMLRNKYLRRNQGEDLTFHNVILAGVHDVKSLKLKIRTGDEHRYNSPWNIAADFEVDLGFSVKEIGTMLQEYAREEKITMNTEAIADKIYYLTYGYPFLVSRLCKMMDEKIISNREWQIDDLDRATQILLKETNTNFDSLMKNIINNPELEDLISSIILKGSEIPYNQDHPLISLGALYGILKAEKGLVKVHNRIYEQRIYNYLSAKTTCASYLARFLQVSNLR